MLQFLIENKRKKNTWFIMHQSMQDVKVNILGKEVLNVRCNFKNKEKQLAKNIDY